MSYSLEDINYRTVTDPKGFLEESDAAYDAKVAAAADKGLMEYYDGEIPDLTSILEG